MSGRPSSSSRPRPPRSPGRRPAPGGLAARLGLLLLKLAILVPALFWAWTYAQPYYSAAVARGTNLLLAVEEVHEPVTRLAPAGTRIAVWSTLRDDGQPAHAYDAGVLHFYIVVCIALVLAFPEPRGWRRWRFLAIMLGLLIGFHVLGLLVTVEHAYAVRIEEISRRNYTPADRAVYEWLYRGFDGLAVRLVPALTLVLLLARYGGILGPREQDPVRSPGGAGEVVPGSAPRRWARRAAAGGLVLLAAGGVLAGGRHLEKVRAREAEALCARAHRLIGSGAVDKAAALFRTSLAMRPRFLEAQDGLGHALLAARDPAPAEGAFREALRIDGSYLPSLIGLADALLMLGRVDEAVETCARARDAHPDRWEPRYGLAQALMRAGKDAEAEPELRRTIEMNPSMAAARLDLGRLLMTSGRACEALPHLEAYVEMEPFSPQADLLHQTIGFARGTCGSEEGAPGAPRP